MLKWLFQVSRDFNLAGWKDRPSTWSRCGANTRLIFHTCVKSQSCALSSSTIPLLAWACDDTRQGVWRCSFSYHTPSLSGGSVSEVKSCLTGARLTSLTLLLCNERVPPEAGWVSPGSVSALPPKCCLGGRSGGSSALITCFASFFRSLLTRAQR